MSFGHTREFLLSLSRVEETLQWEALVFWVGDKVIGGKMFTVLDPEPDAAYVLSFAVPPESYHDLLEVEGVHPAPYLARAHWVAMESWGVFAPGVLRDHLRRAYERTFAKLPRSTQRVLEGSDREYRAAVREKKTVAKAALKTRK